MRIISGKHKGRKLLDFDGMDIRPTTDRVKESIFNLIQEYIPEADVLDMFCGSGALALEALSRGARSAVCIDKDKRSVDVAQKNVHNIGYTEQCRVLNMDCMEYAKICRKQFDIIFLDPPYNKGFIEPVMSSICRYHLLSQAGIIMLESDNTDFFGNADGFKILKQRKYGRTYITIYTHE